MMSEAHFNSRPAGHGSEGTTENSPAVYCRVKRRASQVPKGRLTPVFGRPFETCVIMDRFPALKRRAITGSPSGSEVFNHFSPHGKWRVALGVPKAEKMIVTHAQSVYQMRVPHRRAALLPEELKRQSCTLKQQQIPGLSAAPNFHSEDATRFFPGLNF